MRVGDVLEWLAGAALIAAAYLYLGWPLCLLAAGLCLAYFAQNYDGPLTRRTEKQRDS